jgi:hypothetical protein
MSGNGGDGDEEGRGLGATVGGLVVVIVLVLAGIWLVNELAESARYSKCAAARHRNCDTIDYRAPPQQ